MVKSSENTYPHFFISSDTKNFTVSSDGSKQYRSPTFEAISEEEGNMSPKVVDSPLHKRLIMDIDHPEKFIIRRATKRPPSIHAALSPDISLSDRELMSQNPKILIAHYESIISSMNKDYEKMYMKNEELEIQVSRLETKLSDSNKLLLKVQEDKESDKLKFLSMLNKLNDNKSTRNNQDGSTLKKFFTLEMSSNRTSEEDLHKNSPSVGSFSSRRKLGNNEVDSVSNLQNSNGLSAKESMLTENPDELKAKLLKLRASVKQKDEQIYTLKNLNQNLQAELRTQKQLEEQSKAEVLQQKEKRKESENTIKQLRLELGEKRVEIRKLTSEKDNLSSDYFEIKENFNFLNTDFKELKEENNQLRKQNSKLEKDRQILQTNSDKMNRMLSKLSADSKRYKSVVDLQRSALNELQRDYNQIVDDMSQSVNYEEAVLHRNQKLNQTLNRSSEYEKPTFSQNIL